MSADAANAMRANNANRIQFIGGREPG